MLDRTGCRRLALFCTGNANAIIVNEHVSVPCFKGQSLRVTPAETACP